MASSANTLRDVVKELDRKYHFILIELHEYFKSLKISRPLWQNSSISDEDLARLIQACKTYPELTSLHIGGISPIGEKAVEALCEYISATTSLNELELDQSTIDIASQAKLREVILQHKTLIRVTGFEFYSDEKLKKHLDKNKNPENDSEQTSKEKKFVDLVKSLSSNVHNYGRIKLKDNNTRLVLDSVRNWDVSDKELSELFKSCEHYSPLTAIEIEDIDLKMETLEALSHFIKSSKTIKELSLVHMTISGEKKKEMLFQALLNNTSITDLNYVKDIFYEHQRESLTKHIAENKNKNSKTTTTQSTTPSTTPSTTQQVTNNLRGAASSSSSSKPSVEVKKEEPKTQNKVAASNGSTSSNDSSKKEDTSEKDLERLLKKYPHLATFELTRPNKDSEPIYHNLRDTSQPHIRILCTTMSEEYIILLLKIMASREALKKLELPRMTFTPEAITMLIKFMSTGTWEELNLPGAIIQRYDDRERLTDAVAELPMTKKINGKVIFGNSDQRHNLDRHLVLSNIPRKPKTLPPPAMNEEEYPVLTIRPTTALPRPTKRW